jgi:AcrR family transcriptional regulator
MARAYNQQKRAAGAAETRLRIIQSAVALYRAVGPRSTTITEVARGAGVERLTVYNHFPTEAALATASWSHWLTLNPMPAFEAWAEYEKPKGRLRRALDALYAWYESTEPMLENVLRDAPAMPSLAEVRERMGRNERRMIEILGHGWPDRAAARATLAVAIDFSTWQGVVRRGGLSRDEAIALVVSWMKAAID